MAEYKSYQLLPSLMGLEKGDVVLLTSDITDLFLQCQEHGEVFSPNLLLDGFQEAVGDEGTLLIPTYHWGFCQGKTFDYRKTPGKTGALGNAALRRQDFHRTKHPIYSFAVWGKDTEYLCSLENVESFGSDSPFAYLERVDGKNAFIGSASIRNSFTYIHYVEQKLGASYRYSKMFTSRYVDQEGKETEKGYSMYVRDLDLDVVCRPDPFADDLFADGKIKSGDINGVPFEVIRFSDVTPYITNDILFNRSRKLCTYKGQRII